MKLRDVFCVGAAAGLLGVILGLENAKSSVSKDEIKKERVEFTDFDTGQPFKASTYKPKLILMREYGLHNTSGKLYEDTNVNGKLDSQDLYLTLTKEPAWKNNQKNISCIPEGTYNVRPRSPSESRKFKTKHFWVENVPGRTAILIHGMGRSEGCIMTPELERLVNRYKNGFELTIQ
jgi:hypothetical protein